MFSNFVVLITEDFCGQHSELARCLSTLSVSSVICRSEPVEMEINIVKYKPGIVVINSSRLGLDLVCKLVQKTESMDSRPVIYNIYSYEDSESIVKLQRIGIKYILSLPCAADVVAGHIKMIADSTPVDIDDLKKKIREDLCILLKMLNVSFNQNGMDYIIDAVMYMLFHSIYRLNLSGEIYPYIAELHGSTPQSVEHSIRLAVSRSWTRTDKNTLSGIFSEIMFTAKKPTNTAFLVSLTQYIKREYNQYFEKCCFDKSNSTNPDLHTL